MRGEPKSIRRYLLRHGDGKELEREYVDAAGNVWPYEWLAKLSSFVAIMCGCFRNGFPVVRKRMRYSGWAFWPFFFVRADTDDKMVRSTINHERIHIRQQWDIHRTITFPLLALCIVLEFCGHTIPFRLLAFTPFIPTILYGIDMLRVLVFWNKTKGKPTFTSLREGTCFEMEARMHQLNDDYLADRKMWAVFKHLG